MCLTDLPEPAPTLAIEEVNHEYEDFILEDTPEAVKFPHWTAHLRSFWGWYGEEPDYRCTEEDLPQLKQVISDGLRAIGYLDFAKNIEAAENDAAINAEIIFQYTSETGLYGDVNRLLRTSHRGDILRGNPLAAWILQLNSAIRQKPEFEGISYRGSNMQSSEIIQYQPGLMFVWSAFISASQNRDIAIDHRGNVLFDIKPGGSYSMYGKRNPFNISEHSNFPGEQEVVFPIACTYRVINIRKDAHRTLISLQTVDQY